VRTVAGRLTATTGIDEVTIATDFDIFARQHPP
jgi:hypothetical protein